MKKLHKQKEKDQGFITVEYIGITPTLSKRAEHDSLSAVHPSDDHNSKSDNQSLGVAVQKPSGGFEGIKRFDLGKLKEVQTVSELEAMYVSA